MFSSFLYPILRPFQQRKRLITPSTHPQTKQKICGLRRRMCYVKPTAGCRRYTPFPGTTRAPSSLGLGCTFSYPRGFLGSGDQLAHQANKQGRDSKIEGGEKLLATWVLLTFTSLVRGQELNKGYWVVWQLQTLGILLFTRENKGNSGGRRHACGMGSFNTQVL